jgi:hypothetical protein
MDNKRLTPKQEKVIDLLKKKGILYTAHVGFGPTLESLVKRGIAVKVSETHFGKTYRLVEVRA